MIKTVDEFNEKYKDYLDEGHYGLAISTPEIITYLDDVFEHVLTKIPRFKYQQIKTKFNTTRFYSNSKSRYLQGMIEQRMDDIFKELKDKDK